MSVLHLLPFNDEEIALLTNAVGRWAERNHINIQSEHGKLTMAQAVSLVSSGVRSVDAIVARLDQICTPPLETLAQSISSPSDDRRPLPTSSGT